MNVWLIHIYALSIAFCSKEFLVRFSWWPKSLRKQPFNCMVCMSGWTALGLGIYYYHYTGLWFVFTGLALGSIVSMLIMKYL